MPAHKKKQIPVVLVGLGRIGLSLEKDPRRQKPCTHAGTIQALPGLYSLAAGIDPHEPARREFSKTCPGRPVYTSLKDFSEDRPAKRGVDSNRPLFVIAADSEQHAQLLGAILKLQPAGVLIEKPVCLSTSEYNKLTKIAQGANKRDIPIWVNHERRFHPAYMYVAHKLAQAREAQDPKHPDHLLEVHSWLSCGGHFDRPFEENSPLYHDGTHILDAANFLMGVPVRGRRRVQVINANFQKRRAGLTLKYGSVFHTVTLRSGADYFAFELQVRTRSALYVLGNGYFYEHLSKESPYYTGFRSLKLEAPQKTTSRVNRFTRQMKLTPSPFLNLYMALHSELLRAIKGKPSQGIVKKIKPTASSSGKASKIRKLSAKNAKPSPQAASDLYAGLEVIRQIHTAHLHKNRK